MRSCLPHAKASPGEGCDRRTEGPTRCPDHERAFQRWRNAQPARQELYQDGWPALSRAIREATPYCTDADAGPACSGGLTVDHVLLVPLCRHHHGALEARRRADARAAHPIRSS